MLTHFIFREALRGNIIHNLDAFGRTAESFRTSDSFANRHFQLVLKDPAEFELEVLLKLSATFAS